MNFVDEIHSFSLINAAGETEALGTMAADTVPCVHRALLAIARNNARCASPYDVGALAAALDEAFMACERVPGNAVVREARLGAKRIVCTRTLH